MKVEDITTDFSDGVRFINLLEILSQKSMGKYDTKPAVLKGTATTVARQAQITFRQNIDKAFAFCAREGV